MGGKYTLEEHQASVEAESKRKAKEEQDRKERFEKDAARRGWVADGGNAAAPHEGVGGSCHPAPMVQ